MKFNLELNDGIIRNHIITRCGLVVVGLFVNNECAGCVFIGTSFANNGVWILKLQLVNFHIYRSCDSMSVELYH